jgi:hypothetical protein
MFSGVGRIDDWIGERGKRIAVPGLPRRHAGDKDEGGAKSSDDARAHGGSHTNLKMLFHGNSRTVGRHSILQRLAVQVAVQARLALQEAIAILSWSFGWIYDVETVTRRAVKT